MSNNKLLVIKDVIIITITSIIMTIFVSIILSDINNNKKSCEPDNYENDIKLSLPYKNQYPYKDLYAMGPSPAILGNAFSIENWKWYDTIYLIIIWVSGLIFNKSLKRIADNTIYKKNR